MALRPFYTSAANVHHSDGVELAQGDVFMLAHKVSVSSRRRDLYEMHQNLLLLPRAECELWVSL